MKWQTKTTIGCLIFMVLTTMYYATCHCDGEQNGAEHEQSGQVDRTGVEGDAESPE